METRADRLLIFGLGYSGAAVAKGALTAGFSIAATRRRPADATASPGVDIIPLDGAEAAIAGATHVLATVAPDPAGDPVLARYHNAIGAAPSLRWIGYLSTTGVYGDRGGGWVDEDTEPTPTAERSRRRLDVEMAWRTIAEGRALDLFRLAGIYGPGRSVFDDLRSGRARRVIKPGHAFGRIHRDDIAQAVLAAMRQKAQPGVRVFNLADDEPAESASVIEAAARLLGVPPPRAVPFEEAASRMSPMALSFWSDNRKVSSAKTRAALGIAWLHPTYREGLAAILREERGESAFE
jgi:nucleoside-diphosphate-sugar epimerase